MNEELTNLLEGIETANNIKQYEEGLADVVKGAGRAIANAFGTKAGAAQRNLKAAQDQAAANQANANLVNAQQAAQQILKTLQNDITKTKQRSWYGCILTYTILRPLSVQILMPNK